MNSVVKVIIIYEETKFFSRFSYCIGEKQQYFSLFAQKIHFFEKKLPKNLSIQKLLVPLHSQLSREAIAQMAESVDALVSNTSGAIHPGSIPGLGTRREKFYFSLFFCIFHKSLKPILTVSP